MYIPTTRWVQGASGTAYRFQWNFPMFFLLTIPKTLCRGPIICMQLQMKARPQELLSPDLTKNDSSRMEASVDPLQG